MARYRQLGIGKDSGIRAKVNPNPEVWTGTILDSIRSGNYGVTPTVEGYEKFDNDIRTLIVNTR